MRLNIELMNNLEHNCVDGLIASVAKWNNRAYELAYANAWDFSIYYEIKGENTFAQLNIPITLDYDILKSNNGIDLKYIEFNKNKNDFLTILKKELAQQRPIIIILNYCWCPWNKEVSNITDMPGHASLVVGFDELGLNCLDYSPRCENCILPYENIVNIDGYATIKFDDKPMYGNDYKEIITKSINLIESHDIFNAMREFGNFMQESFDPVKYLNEVENDAWLPNVWQISLISESRGLFSKTLKTISVMSKIESLVTIAERLELAKPMWSTVKVLLTKIYYNNDLRLKEKIAQQIYEIADFEENIYRSLVSIIK